MKVQIPIPDVGIFREIRRDGYYCQGIHGMPNFPKSRVIDPKNLSKRWANERINIPQELIDMMPPADPFTGA